MSKTVRFKTDRDQGRGGFNQFSSMKWLSYILIQWFEGSHIKVLKFRAVLYDSCNFSHVLSQLSPFLASVQKSDSQSPVQFSTIVQCKIQSKSFNQMIPD